MTQMQKINKLKTAISMIVIIILISCYLNDFHIYPIQQASLEENLLQQMNTKEAEGKILAKKDVPQGRAYIVLGGDEKIAFVIYVKSLYSNRWRQEHFDNVVEENGKPKIKTINNNYLSAATKENPYQFPDALETQLFRYDITWVLDLKKEENSDIIVAEEAESMLTMKTFTIGIILISWFAGRIIGFAKQKKKRY